MSELAATIREALTALAAADPRCMRFGAAGHRYELAAPVAAVAVGVDDLRAFATTIGSGGAGPGYGWIPIERALHAPVATAAGPAIPIAHLGCGYAAVLPLADGRIWLDARELGTTTPIADSFTAFYVDWVERSLRGSWPDLHVPAGACALPNALSGYLAACEQARGVPAGSLAGAELRSALADLGTGAIAIGAGPPLFERGDRADPCIACARLLENLGLPREVVAAGQPPLLLR